MGALAAAVEEDGGAVGAAFCARQATGAEGFGQDHRLLSSRWMALLPCVCSDCLFQKQDHTKSRLLPQRTPAFCTTGRLRGHDPFCFTLPKARRIWAVETTAPGTLSARASQIVQLISSSLWVVPRETRSPRRVNLREGGQLTRTSSTCSQRRASLRTRIGALRMLL